MRLCLRPAKDLSDWLGGHVSPCLVDIFPSKGQHPCLFAYGGNDLIMDLVVPVDVS